jgi:hypothetical protein
MQARDGAHAGATAEAHGIRLAVVAFAALLDAIGFAYSALTLLPTSGGKVLAGEYAAKPLRGRPP